MSTKRFNFSFKLSDGSTISTATDPVDMGNDLNHVYSSNSFQRDNMVVDGQFGSDSVIPQIPDTLEAHSDFLNMVLGGSLSNKMFTLLPDGSGMYMKEVPALVRRTLLANGLTSARADGQIHLYVEASVYHSWDLRVTGTTDRRIIPTGQSRTCLLDFGYVPLKLPVTDHYIITAGDVDMMIDRMLQPCHSVPSYPKLFPVDWEQGWRQASGVTQSPSGARWLTTVEASYLASPY